jgi:transposase-like protein
VVLWRLRYKLALRDLPEMFLIRGIVFSHEAVRDWEAKPMPDGQATDRRSTDDAYGRRPSDDIVVRPRKRSAAGVRRSEDIQQYGKS